MALVLPTLLAGVLLGCSGSKKAPPAEPAPAAAESTKPLTAEETAEITVTATVKAVNQATREVTLMSASGDSIPIKVGPSVRRLNEVMVGDEVSVTYYVSISGELRAPTADEAEHPIMLIDAAGRASSSQDPAGGVVRAVRIVTTVTEADLARMLVTLKGPMGDQVTIRAKKPENVRRIHVGDTVVVTYTEALAVSLEKVAPRK